MRIFIRCLPFWLTAGFLLSGCPLIRPPPTKSVMRVPPELDRIRLSNGGVHSLQGIAGFELKYGEKRWRARQAIALAKPGRIRLETLNSLDQPLVILATDGTVLQLLSLPEDRLYEGAVSKGLSRFIHVRLSSEDFIALILGELPSEADPPLYHDPSKDLIQVRFPPTTRWKGQHFWIHPKTLKVVELSKTDALTGHEIRVFFSHFHKSGSETFPRRIRLEVPDMHNRIRFNFRDLEINIPLPSDLFRIPHLPGIEVVGIGDDMGEFSPGLAPIGSSSNP